MMRQNIHSTNIKSVGYEDGKLEIEFKNRSIKIVWFKRDRD